MFDAENSNKFLKFQITEHLFVISENTKKLKLTMVVLGRRYVYVLCMTNLLVIFAHAYAISLI